MIGKVIRGRRVPRLLAYLYGPGRHCEHVDPHTVAGWDDPAELEPPVLPDGRRNTAPLAALLEEPVWAARRRPARPVWQGVLRAAPADRRLTDGEWRQIAEDTMHRCGLARRGDLSGCRWVAVRHADDHIHIVATLVRQDGTRAEPHNDYYRLAEACAAAERRFGLAVTPGRDRTAAVRPSRAETERARRAGRAEPARDELRRRVQLVAAQSADVPQFLIRLREEGLLVRRRDSHTQPGEITGYAVALPDYRAADGQPVWFGGGRLAADLSLPKLRARWIEPAPSNHARLREVVRAAAGHSIGTHGFFARLREDGLLVRPRHSTLHPNEVTGYAVALPGHVGRDGQPVWFSGGRLAADLSLPRLRRRWADPVVRSRAHLRASVQASADQTGDLDGFVAALRRDGLLVRLRESTLVPGEITGYAVAAPAPPADDREPVWYGGATLSPDLSLPALRRRWRSPSPAVHLPHAGQHRGAGPATSRTAAAQPIQQAAQLAGDATEQLRRATTDDPRAAAVAHATADLYSATARVLDGRSGGALTQAADAYARAARTPWGQTPPRTPAADELRRVARRLLLAGRLTSARKATAMQTLLLQLAATADALAELRDSQQRGAQAAAARHAAQAATRRVSPLLAAATAGPPPAPPQPGPTKPHPPAHRPATGATRRRPP